MGLSINITDSHQLTEGVIKYMICQLGGYNPMCEDIRREFEKHSHPAIETATYVLLALVSWVYYCLPYAFKILKECSK